MLNPSSVAVGSTTASIPSTDANNDSQVVPLGTPVLPVSPSSLGLDDDDMNAKDVKDCAGVLQSVHIAIVVEEPPKTPKQAHAPGQDDASSGSPRRCDVVVSALGFAGSPSYDAGFANNLEDEFKKTKSIPPPTLP